jgi:5-methylcytosine-specific restriction endonuclease McrBC regulatory subunit McrC
LRYIWQKYLLSFCKNHFKQYKVYNPVFSDTESGHHWNTDLAIVDKDNKFTLIADAKWYESSDMSSGNISQVNMYESLYIKENTEYNTTGLLLYASNDITQCRPTVKVDNGKSVTEVCINVNQDKDALEQDIITCISNYMNPEYTN